MPPLRIQRPPRDYNYDRNGQLTGDGTAASPYNWDANGNPTDSGLVAGAGNRLTTDGTWDLEYDDEGNLVKKTHGTTEEVWLLSYDHHNRLTQAEHKASAGAATVDQRVIYASDALGNRSERTFDIDGDVCRTTFWSHSLPN